MDNSPPQETYTGKQHVLVKAGRIPLLTTAMVAKHLQANYPELPAEAVKDTLLNTNRMEAYVYDVKTDDDEKAARREANADGTLEQYWAEKAEDIADSIASDLYRRLNIKVPTWHQWAEGSGSDTVQHFQSPGGERFTTRTPDEYWAAMQKVGKTRLVRGAPVAEAAAVKVVDQMLEDREVDRYVDMAAHDLRYGGKLLAMQPENSEALVTYTHFDCWSDRDDDYNVEPWDWDSPKAQKLFNSLCNGWAKVEGMDVPALRQIQKNYLNLGVDRAFSEIADLFVKAGFSVYHSDAMFEVYDPEFLTAEENVGDNEV